LAVQVPFGLFVYWLLVYVIRLQAYQDVRTLAAEQWRLRREKVTPAGGSI
jgi:hypothetical protein